MTAFSTKKFLSASLSLSAVAGALSFAQPAFAQNAPAAEEADASDDIVVTARKREENLLDVPLTVTALTSEALEAKGVVSMQSLASSTPGININDSSSGHADRAFQQIVLRGFTSNSTLNTTTSLFIDGVPLSSPSAFTAISNPARIDIMKGPQSAFFGRNTFAGAINVVNKEPGNKISGSITGMIGTHNNYRLQAEIEGPIIEDKLGVRLGVDWFSKHGSWRNEVDGSTLGDQSSFSATALVVFKPIERITIKGFVLASRDKDGAPANARLLAYDVKNSAGAVLLKGQSNCTFQGDTSGIAGVTGTTVTNPYFCGTLPGLVNPLEANSIVDATTTNLLSVAPAKRLIPFDRGIQQYGLLRKFRHYHIATDVELTDEIKLSLLAGWNREEWNTLIDLDALDGRRFPVGSSPNISAVSPRGYFDFPFLVERTTRDNSLEARLSYDTDKFHGVAGFSYLNALVQSGARGGAGIIADGAATGVGNLGGVSQAKTYGGFFGLTYDFTPAFEISVEGRYQIDKIFAFASPSAPTVVTSSALVPAGTYAANSLIVSADYKNFTPRVIASYHISPDAMVYASWAKGVNPSQFNTTILAQSDAVQQSAVQNGVAIAVKPEKITNYEIGLKGKALDGKLTYAIAAYYAEWRDQINSITFLVPLPPPTPVALVTGVQNSGTVNLKGLEVEGVLRASKFLTINFAGAYNDSDIKAFKSRALSQLTGIYDFSGKEMPYFSKYSFNLGAQVGNDIAGWDDGRWFLRADWSYKSGIWTGQANTTKTAARNVVNLRAGITKGMFSLEGFVNNVFNDTNYTSAIDTTMFDPTALFNTRANAAVFVNLPDQRTAGVQVKVKF